MHAVQGSWVILDSPNTLQPGVCVCCVCLSDLLPLALSPVPLPYHHSIPETHEQLHLANQEINDGVEMLAGCLAQCTFLKTWFVC